MNTPAFSDVSELITSWIIEKEKLLNPKIELTPTAKFKTKIKKAKKVIVNNESSIENQNNITKKASKTKKVFTIVGILISILMFIIAVVTNWDKLF